MGKVWRGMEIEDYRWTEADDLNFITPTYVPHYTRQKYEFQFLACYF